MSPPQPAPPDPGRFRPRRFPAPEFPPRRPAPFAAVPPAIFPPLLGLVGLALALRLGLARLGLPAAPGELAAGLALALWAFGFLAYAAKLARRPRVILDDMKVLPARGGLAAATMGAMAAAALIAPHAAAVATGLLHGALGLHVLYVLLFLRVLFVLPPEARRPDPGWHLVFVGPIVGGLAAGILGQEGLARVLLLTTAPPAMVLWLAALFRMRQASPPAPLRPLMAIHLAPASLFASVAHLAGIHMPAHLFAGVAVLIFAALVLSLRWLLAAGFNAMWGALTFPLTAFAAALMRLDSPWGAAGTGVLAVALMVVPWIAWKVLKTWPGGALAARTGAATA